MKDTKTSTFSNGLLWFGAAVSIAEILTGTLLAPLGFKQGVLAIVLGHLIGCVLLFMAGLIGARTEKSSMETVKLSFGQKGSILFSSLNVLQLIGWTAVMIVSGAAAASSIFSIGGQWVWAIIIGALIIIWTLIGIKNLGKVNLVAMSALFILTIILSKVIFSGGVTEIITGNMSFGTAMELSVAMPLSWLPLISDYTRSAKKKLKASLVSATVYFFASCWMYIIGLGAALFTGESDIAKIMLTAGLGIAGLMIVVFSTVTTTFLDVYSAGVSAKAISRKVNEKGFAIMVSVVGTGLAIFTPITKYEDFLLLISSVFAPMIAIQIVDNFILKKDKSSEEFDWLNLAVWAIGFIAFRRLISIDTVIGNTIPVMLIVGVICILANKIFGRK